MTSAMPLEPPLLTPGEALVTLFLTNADQGAHAANDDLVLALPERARHRRSLLDAITALAGEAPELSNAELRARLLEIAGECGCCQQIANDGSLHPCSCDAPRLPTRHEPTGGFLGWIAVRDEVVDGIPTTTDNHDPTYHPDCVRVATPKTTGS